MDTTLAGGNATKAICESMLQFINNLQHILHNSKDDTKMFINTSFKDANTYFTELNKDLEGYKSKYKKYSSRAIAGGGSSRRTRRHLRKLARRTRRMKYAAALNRLKLS